MWCFSMGYFNRYLFYSLITLLISISASADLAVIVHPNSPVTSLSHKQVQKIFLGRTSMYPNTETRVYSIDQSESSEMFQLFYEDVISMSISKLKKYRAYYLFSGKGRLPLPSSSSKQILDLVATTENAISYVDLDEVNEKVKVVFTLP